jgi:2'-5' RNA ligase
MDRATVIVALPSLMDDEVYKISSEEVPHLTLLYLGDVELSAEAMLYVQHAVKELSPFGMSVDYRGTLGEDEADVLFFEKSWAKRVEEFIHHLLLNDEIKNAHDAAPQYDEWQPHLTLGYPEKPAREGDENRIRYVDFDRVAIWTGDFEGPEFRLRYAEYGSEVDSMAWSVEEKGAYAAATIFGGDPKVAKHYGVKGMRWGVRKSEGTRARADSYAIRSERRSGKLGSGAEKRKADRLYKKADRQGRYEDRLLGPKKDSKTSPGSVDRASQKTPTDVTIKRATPGKFVKTTGGKNQPAHEDAIAALALRQKAKSSTTDSLSNTELRRAIERMNLENQYHSASFGSDRRSKGQRFAQGLLGKKRYGQKRQFTDTHEQAGELAKKTAKDAITTANLMKAASKV